MTNRSRLRAGAALVLCGVLTGCFTRPMLDTSRMSALQIRAIQTRSYEGSDPKVALKTVLNVLQDEGFLVDYGNSELGLLHGAKNIDGVAAQRFGEAPVQVGHGYFQTANSFGPVVNVVTIEATANVSGFGGETKVRVNFQRKVANFQQGIVEATPVVDAKYYQEFFAKLERGLFIQKQGL